MVTLVASAARAATTAAATGKAAPLAWRLLPTLTASSVAQPGRQPFGAPLDTTLRITTHDDAAVLVAAAASFEVDIACCGSGGGGVGVGVAGGGGATISPLAATPLVPLSGDGAVHELALPLGAALAALQLRVSADALCNVGLLRLALVVRGGGSAAAATTTPAPAPAATTADAGGGGRAAAAAAAPARCGAGGDPLLAAAAAAAVAAVQEACPPSAAGAASEDGGAVVVAERSLVVEVFRDQREGRVGEDDHDILFRRIFVEE